MKMPGLSREQELESHAGSAFQRYNETLDNWEARMRPRLVKPCRHLPLLHIAFAIALTFLFSGWTSCNGVFVFNSCQDTVPQPQIVSLSPGTIPGDAESVLLVVSGSGFVPGSQIMWNGSALQTTFMDSRHLQTMITQQTFDSFGGSSGSTVRISVKSHSVAELGCPIGGSSATLVLVIN
jgi:hypothetical protein